MDFTPSQVIFEIYKQILYIIIGTPSLLALTNKQKRNRIYYICKHSANSKCHNMLLLMRAVRTLLTSVTLAALRLQIQFMPCHAATSPPCARQQVSGVTAAHRYSEHCTHYLQPRPGSMHLGCSILAETCSAFAGCQHIREDNASGQQMRWLWHLAA